jgi:hypothetical protein
MSYTYHDLIRKYSADVMSGHADRDLSPRQRRLTGVLLNLASNYGGAIVNYPPSPETREATVHYLSDIVWDARPLVVATSPNVDGDFGIALERTLAILRNI